MNGFHVRYIYNVPGHSQGSLSSNEVCRVKSFGNWSGYSVSQGFRPVFTLKSDIKISGGDGSETTPYTLTP